MARELIFMLSPVGKSDEELADEAWQAILKWPKPKPAGRASRPCWTSGSVQTAARPPDMPGQCR
jgi:hypothetical protein